jgi:hypothetical protein
VGVSLKYGDSSRSAFFIEEASRTRGYSVAQTATVRAARPDPSLRKRGLPRMTNRRFLQVKDAC